MLSRPGCECLGSEVVGDGVDLQRSSRANPGGGAQALTAGWLLAAALQQVQLPLVQGERGDSFPFRLVAQRGCQHLMGRAHPRTNIVGAILSLKSHGNAHGFVMATRIFVKGRLLDYALTGTTGNEHWH